MRNPIPSAALDDRLGFFGTAGSGKTYGSGTAVERVLNSGSRCVIVDPLGVWWGLRLREDGKTGSKFDVVIFGGPHGDLALTENSGALIGEAVATSKESCIIDLSQLGTKAAERRFMLAFLTAFYRHTTGEPVHLVFDEADMWAPQRLMDKDGDAAKLLGMMETIVRRGRVKGFIPWLISQRTAVISKDVLSQIDGLVIFKLTSSQDRSAIGDWIEGQADKVQGKEILAKLPAKQRGEAVVWIPGRGVLIEAPFPAKLTFDSSRTPKRGEKAKKTGKLKELDVGKLKEKLAVVETQVKENDPKALKAEIAKLKADLAKAPAKERIVEKTVADPKAVLATYRVGYELGVEAGYRAAVDLSKTVLLRSLSNDLDSIATEVARAKRDLLKNLVVPTTLVPTSKSVPAREAPITSRRDVVAGTLSAEPRPQTPAFKVGNTGNSALPPGEKAVLVAAAQFGRVERDQLSVLTGYKRSSRDAYIARLLQKRFVVVEGRDIVPTDDGVQALGSDYEPLPQGAALREYWLARLPEGEKKVLEVLIEAYPNSIDRDAIDQATGYKRSSRDAYLARMKQKRIVVSRGSQVAASETLF